MAQVTLTINGRNYSITCDNGQEQRVTNLGHYVDQRIKAIARAGAASNEAHLLVLTTLMLSDEIFELRDKLSQLDSELQDRDSFEDQEALIVHAIEQLAGRIDVIAGRIQKA